MEVIYLSTSVIWNMAMDIEQANMQPLDIVRWKAVPVHSSLKTSAGFDAW